jgi:hypothetical protein
MRTGLIFELLHNPLHILMAHLEQLLQQVEDAEFIPWSKIGDALHLALETGDIRGNLHRILNDIEKHQVRDLARTKQILDLRAGHYDALIARLQYLEQNQLESNQEDVESEDQCESSEFGSEEEEDQSDSGVFHFEPEDSLLRLQISRPVSINCYHEDEVQGDRQKDQIQAKELEIQELKRQNDQYLALGLSWKTKYESVQAALKRTTNEHRKEVDRIYALYKKSISRPLVS